MTTATIRLARPADAAAVAALAALIWDGEDYAPRRFHAWLRDPDGRFFVVLLDGALAGFGKLTCKGDGEWWLEGLRVHPGLRGQGLGRLLHQTGVALADQLGRGTLRFSTASTNGATQALAEETGFHVVCRHRLGWWVSSQAAAPSRSDNRSPAELLARHEAWRPCSPDDLSGVRERLQRHASWSQGGGLLLDGWHAYEILPRLDALAAAGRLVHWRDSVAPAIVGWRGDQLRLNFAPLSQNLLPGFLRDLEEALLLSGISRARVSPPADWCPPGREPPGWEWAEDFDLLLFARTLASPPEWARAESGSAAGVRSASGPADDERT